MRLEWSGWRLRQACPRRRLTSSDKSWASTAVAVNSTPMDSHPLFFPFLPFPLHFSFFYRPLFFIMCACVNFSLSVGHRHMSLWVSLPVLVLWGACHALLALPDRQEGGWDSSEAAPSVCALAPRGWLPWNWNLKFPLNVHHLPDLGGYHGRQGNRVTFGVI